MIYAAVVMKEKKVYKWILRWICYGLRANKVMCVNLNNILRLYPRPLRPEHYAKDKPVPCCKRNNTSELHASELESLV